MKQRMIIMLALAIMLPALNGFGQEVDLPTPETLIENVKAKYEELETYATSGTIRMQMEHAGMSMHTITTFTMQLHKPDRYRIEWIQSLPMRAGTTQSGAVWSSGEAAYLYLSGLGAYSRMQSDEEALAGATGVSGGAAFTIPSLFLNIPGGADQTVGLLKTPIVEGIESIAGDDCYVLSGPTPVSMKETYWISVDNFLIRQHRRSLEPPEEGLPMGEMSDEEMEKAFEDMPPEQRAQHEEAMRQAREQMKAARQMMAAMKGATTATFHEIATPPFKTENFEFVPPEGTVLKDDLFSMGGAKQGQPHGSPMGH